MLQKSLFAAFAFCAMLAGNTAQAEVLAAAETSTGALIQLHDDEDREVCMKLAEENQWPFFKASLLERDGSMENGCWTVNPEGDKVVVKWDEVESAIVYPLDAFRDPMAK